MIGAYPSVVVRVVSAVLSPFIAVFGLYIIAHGHYGPGGGFAGGVFLAVGVILPRLTLPEPVSHRLAPPSLGPLTGAIGMLVFLACGIIPMLFGGAFLDYSALEFAGVEPARVRYLGILIVEIAVGLAVFGAMLLVFDVLTARDEPAARASAAPPAPARTEVTK